MRAASRRTSRAGFRTRQRSGDPRGLEKAFDYRGDVTITRKDGAKVEGYLFDRRSGSSLADSFVRIIPTNAKTKVNVSLRRYRRAGLHWPRYGGGQDLRGLGEEVLGEEGGGREEYPDRAGEAGLTFTQGFALQKGTTDSARIHHGSDRLRGRPCGAASMPLRARLCVC